VGDFNTPLGDFIIPLSPIEMSSRLKKINKEILELNGNIDLMGLTNINRVQYIFFSAAHRTFSNIDHVLGHKPGFNKYKKIEISLCILSDHNAMKLEFNKRSSRK
jgi:hypothetical protein